MHRHPDTLFPLEASGRSYPDYRPTFPFNGPYLDSFHRSLATGPLKDGFLIQLRNGRWWGGDVIPGWLRRADALKLYELAYFADGDILEIGSFAGLSTTLLALANRRAPRRKRIVSVDLDPQRVRDTEANLRAKGLRAEVTTLVSEGAAAARQLAAQGRRFSLVFIDHSHAYGPVRSLCEELPDLCTPGAFCLFHDFNDPRNADPREEEYGVYQAVTETLRPPHFEFYGAYGCSGLYRRS